MARSPRGLSTSDLERIRTTLAGGRRPKVVFTDAAGQLAGQQGQVVELTDPASNDEWVVVRFGKDTLPFAPTDLAVAPKVPAARRGGRPGQLAAPVETAAAPAPAATPAAAAPAAPASATPANASPAGAGPAAEPATRKPAPAGSPATGAARKPASEPKPAPVEVARRLTAVPRAETEPARRPVRAEAQPEAARKPARKSAKGKAPVALTVTLSYAGGEWTVAAQQGTRALARPTPIRPAEALQMVGQLDLPEVADAVEEIVNTARAEAEQEADRLRAELAEIEARLAELPDRH